MSNFSANSLDKYLLGDVNQDGVVTIRDATFIQMYLAKIAQAFEIIDNNSKILADVNEDGVINIIDATIIQKNRVGIDTNTRVNQYISNTEPTTQPETDNQWLPGFFD